MANKLKIPKDWKEIKVSKAFEFIPTTSHSKGEMNYKEGNNSSIYNIHYGDIHAKYSTYVDFEKDKIPHLKDAKNGFDKNLLKSGDLVMVDASEDLEGVGTCIEIKNLHNKKCVAGLHTFALRDSKKNTVPGYRGLMLKHKAVKHRMQQVSTYSKVFGMSKKSFSDIDLILPPLPEQEKIVEVLETWDEYIEKLEATLKCKKQIKGGLMQKLFKFNDSHKIITLKEACAINPKSKDLPFEFIYIDLESVEKGTLRKEKVIKLENAPSRAQRKLQKGDILFQTVRPYQKNNLYFNKNGHYVASTGYAQLRTQQNPGYLYYLLHTDAFVNRVLDKCTGSNYPAINSTDLGKIKIPLPSIPEQTAIAQILTTADKEIEALEKKRELIEGQKKFLLNNLVTGKIRLPEFINAN